MRDLVGSEDIAEGWHAVATVVDLALDFSRFEMTSDAGEIWALVGAGEVDAVAVFAAFFVEEGGSGSAVRFRGRMDGGGCVRGQEEKGGWREESEEERCAAKTRGHEFIWMPMCAGGERDYCWVALKAVGRGPEGRAEGASSSWACQTTLSLATSVWLRRYSSA